MELIFDFIMIEKNLSIYEINVLSVTFYDENLTGITGRNLDV